MLFSKFTDLGDYDHDRMLEHLHPQRSHFPICRGSISAPPRPPGNHQSAICIALPCFKKTLHVNRIAPQVAFALWLRSLGVTFLRSVRVVACIGTASLFIAKQCSVVRINHLWFVHSPADRHVDCFRFWPIINNAAVNV